MRSILTLNAGSSSLKFALFSLVGVQTTPILRGRVEGLGSVATFHVENGTGGTELNRRLGPDDAPRDANGALDLVLAWLFARFPRLDLVAVGHRVVHGGATYSRPTVVDDAVFSVLERLVPLAPLHQPFNLKGIVAAHKAFPHVPQIACFDTAFHHGQAFHETAFGLPHSYHDEGIRRYGFHGLSYDYIARQMGRIAPAVADGRLIVAHLGNGASLCAIRNGKSVASTMGFSALDGLMMGTRCGQLDPGVMLYLMREKGMDEAKLTELLYKDSGLKGLSGLSHDMRILENSSDPRAIDAIACFVARIRREVGAMATTLGGVDALVFTGGIGENSAKIRSQVTSGFDWLSIALDDPLNEQGAFEISSTTSAVRVFRLPTDEEAMIARHVVGLMVAAAADLVPLDKVSWVA